jgi:hypothetical protein
MSEAPFELRGQLPHRILAPLLAWLCGCGGDSYVAFVRGLTVVMLATVFYLCRRHQSAIVDALLITLAIAVTAPVQKYKLHWVGYSDPLCYTLFLLAMLAARRPVLFWSLFFANLLNHELAVFLLPWLWYLRRRQDQRWRLDLLAAGSALALYAVFYLLVKAHAEQQLFNADYFLQHPLFPGGTVAVWALALVHWLVAYGPILIVLAWHQHTRGEGHDPWHLWLVLLGIMVIFCIAFDWPRHTNLILMPLVLASIRFLAAGTTHRVIYAVLVFSCVALFEVASPWPPTARPTHDIVALALRPDIGLVIEVEDGYGFGSLDAALFQWLPAAWPILWPLLAVLAGIWAFGAVFRRR